MACKLSSFLPPYEMHYGLLGTHDHKQCLVALESVSVDILVRGFVAQVSAKLSYCNTTQHVLQVAAVFPVDESAAVYHCEAEIGGRTIVTHCMERKQAEKEFDKAVKEGKTAVMTREHQLTADILNLDLGNLPAGSKAVINLRLIMELRVKANGGVSFVLPTVLNPRYYPADLQEFIDLSQLRSDGVVFAPQPYEMEVKATIKGNHTIAGVTSHTDNLTVTLKDDDMTAEVQQHSGFQSDHDWSMLISYNDPYKPHVIRETGDRSGTGIMKDDLIMLNFFPKIPINSFSSKNELIFVLDRSGSMEGTNIVNARGTLLLFLKSLPPGCLFNVVSFGSTFSVLFPGGSKEYSEKSVQEACDLCAYMEADMGGTEILSPLENIYSKEPSPHYSRQIMVITDGQVFNVDQVTQLVARHSHETRVFCVGIGEGASTALVRGIARAGKGRAEMVQNANDLQQSVMDLMVSLVQESVSEVEVSCEVEPANRVRLVPKVPPVIFGDQHVILYARVPPDTQVKKMSLRGKIGTQTIEEKLEGQHFTVVHDEAKSLHRLAARAQIRQWQLDEEEDVAEEMLALSLSSGVVCRRTALIGIDQESGTIITNLQMQPEPCRRRYYGVQIGGGLAFASPPRPRLIGGGCGSPPPSQRNAMMCSPVPYCEMMMTQTFETETATKIRKFDCLQDESNCVVISSSSGSSSPESSTRDKEHDDRGDATFGGDLMMEVVNLQKFDGSWRLEDAAKLSGVAITELSDSNPAKTEESWATALVLVLLERKFDSKKNLWALLAVKARNFITSCGDQPNDLVDKARLIIKM